MKCDESSLDRCRDFCRDTKTKFTVVDLEKDDRSQRDVMITAHFRDANRCAVNRISQKLIVLCDSATKIGFPVERAKLEHESLPTISPFSEANYHEVHIKLSIAGKSYPSEYDRLKQLGDQLDFVPSRNPFQRTEDHVIQFANLRIYSGDQGDADAKVSVVEQALADAEFNVVETKRETVVFDTAHQLDAWWA